jgi:hypothetical protein
MTLIMRISGDCGFQGILASVRRLVFANGHSKINGCAI